MHRQWSSLVCLLALSSEVKVPIESYFPITHTESTSKEKIESLSTLFNYTIYPRETVASISDEKIHIFRLTFHLTIVMLLFQVILEVNISPYYLYAAVSA